MIFHSNKLITVLRTALTKLQYKLVDETTHEVNKNFQILISRENNFVLSRYFGCLDILFSIASEISKNPSDNFKILNLTLISQLDFFTQFFYQTCNGP